MKFMRGSRAARGRRLLPVVLVLVLVAACEAAPPTESPTPAATPPDNGAPTAAPATATPPAATEAPPRGTPAPGGSRLSVGQASEISTLDPAVGYDFYSWPWERLIFETLITYDAGADLVPQLASAMPQVSGDGRTYTFTLRPGVNFVSRDGTILREMTADDVAYSLNRILDPNLTPTPSPVAETFFALIEGAQAVIAGEAEGASGIRVIDRLTIEITISEADPTFLNVLAMPFGSVVPHQLAGTDTVAFSTDPAGTGPYLLVEWTPAQRAIFARNPHYWDAAFAGPPEIEVRLGVDPDSQLQQVQTGRLHIQVDAITPGQYTATVNDPRWADYLRTTETLSVTYVTIDTATDGPLTNVLVRRALSHAIDRDNIVLISNNRNTPATCFFPPGMPGYDEACNLYPYDPDMARDLLREAGYEDGFATKLYTFDVDPGPQQAQAIQQDLGDIGVELEVILQPFDTLLETIFVQGQAPLVLIGWIADFPDPSNFIEPIITCAAAEAGFNISWYCNPEVDRLVAAARTQPRDERLQTYQEIQRLVMEDAPWIPLEYPGIQILVHPSVDFFFHPVWQFDYARYTVTE